MNNQEFVNKLLAIYTMKTKYAYGCFGQKKTDPFIDNKAKQYPGWYTTSRVAELKALPSDTYLFDCVNLIKAVLWGFPNTKYASNAVPDINANTIIQKCTDISTDFKDIKVGELLWMDGHVGIYIGDGKGIECTSKWEGKVLISNVTGTIGNQDAKFTRTWKKHGKLPYITYNDIFKEEPAQTNADRINQLEMTLLQIKALIEEVDLKC